MKLAKTIILGSVAALLFSNNVFATANLTDKASVKNEIARLIEQSIVEIEKPDTKILVANDLKKQQLELHTQTLVARATESLPRGFKVVIAE